MLLICNFLLYVIFIYWLKWKEQEALAHHISRGSRYQYYTCTITAELQLSVFQFKRGNDPGKDKIVNQFI